jgi:hypothetical protein
MVKNGGYYIHYPDIRKTAQFISADGVHLTALGNGIFLNTLQGASYASDFHRPDILICSSDTPFMAHVGAIPILNECEAYWASSIPKVWKHFFQN